MKEYRGFKYYELNEIKNDYIFNGLFRNPNFPYITVISDDNLNIKTGLTIREIAESDNPEELVETFSKQTIDEYLYHREKFQNK